MGDINNIDYLRGAKEAFTVIIETCKNENQRLSNEILYEIDCCSKLTILIIDELINQILDNMQKEEQRND